MLAMKVYEFLPHIHSLLPGLISECFEIAGGEMVVGVLLA